MLSNVGTIPFRRLTDPIQLPTSPTASSTAVPANFIPPDANSFRVTNPNNFWVRLKGYTGAGASAGRVAATEGWLFPPGFSGTFTTQFPDYMSTMSVGPSAGTGVLEVSYGIGGGGESAFYTITASSGGTGGNVTVQNVPLPVSDNGGSLTVDGAVSITGALPAGTNALGSVSVSNFPATQPISGSVTVANFPATQPISGTVAVSNPTAGMIGAGTVLTGQVAVNNTAAVQVVAARATRRKVTLAPSTQFTYFVGASGVTASTGFAVLNGGAITLETTAAVFVIANSNGPMTFVETF